MLLGAHLFLNTPKRVSLRSHLPLPIDFYPPPLLALVGESNLKRGTA
jgi:hypothetical protein